MKIGILGTRGLPNAFGGFEQVAGYLSQGLIRRGPSAWKQKNLENVKILYNWDRIIDDYEKAMLDRSGIPM